MTHRKAEIQNVRNHTNRPSKSDWVIVPIVDFMLKNLNRPLRVSTLSAVAGYCSSHFSQLFKHETGYSPLDFFIRARMKRACELLEDTALSIKEIAALMGYECQFHFSRRFKSVNGVGPQEYRRIRDKVKTRGGRNGISIRLPDRKLPDPAAVTRSNVRFNSVSYPSRSHLKAGGSICSVQLNNNNYR